MTHFSEFVPVARNCGRLICACGWRSPLINDGVMFGDEFTTAEEAHKEHMKEKERNEMDEQHQRDLAVVQNPYSTPSPVVPAPTMNDQAEEAAARDKAARALAEIMQSTHRRADWAFNPDDIFICGNGHLQYNINAMEREEMIARGVTPKPIAYEGGVCSHCPNPPLSLTKLTSNPKELQQKLGTSMERVAQLSGLLTPLQEASKDQNIIAGFLAQQYAWEIHEGQEQHNGAVSKAVIHYLRLERGRWSVRRGQWWRALRRMMGVG